MFLNIFERIDPLLIPGLLHLINADTKLQELTAHNSTPCYGNEYAMPIDWNGDPRNLGVALPDVTMLWITMDHFGKFSTNIARLDNIIGDGKPYPGAGNQQEVSDSRQTSPATGKAVADATNAYTINAKG
jgi:hypothetical protein